MPLHAPWPVKPPHGWPLDPLAPIAGKLANCWPLVEGAGATARDVVGGGGAVTGNALTFNGTTSWSALGPDGPAVRFPGSGTAYLQTAGSVFNPASGDFSAAAWFNVDALTGTAQILLVNLNGTGTGRNWLNVSGTGFITSFLGGASTTGTTTVTAGVWHLGVVTVQGTTVSVYLDGKLEASATRTIDTNVGTLRVGVSSTGTLPLAGYVGRAGIMTWTRALSAIEVLSLHAAAYQPWMPRRSASARVRAVSGGPWPWFLDNAMAGGYAPMGM